MTRPLTDSHLDAKCRHYLMFDQSTPEEGVVIHCELRLSHSGTHEAHFTSTLGPDSGAIATVTWEAS